MENRTTLRWGAQEVGRLTAAPEGADTCFRAEYRLTEGLWRLYAVGRQNRLLLGCAEGGQGILQRRFSRQLTEGLGALLGGAAEPVSTPEDWRPVWAGEFPGLALPEGALCRTPYMTEASHREGCYALCISALLPSEAPRHISHTGGDTGDP